MNITERLKNLREEKNLRIYDISKYLGIDKDLYGKYERQNVIIPIKHLIDISKYFNVSIDYIFGFNDLKSYKDSKTINIELMSKRLREFRKDNKLTQIALAEILKSDNSTISKYEKGIYIIATPFLYDICKKYNISADYLLGRVDEPKFLK